MAKVVNGGNKKGKIGNSIYYTIKNSNNKVTQGERIYQPNVTNPQSENQRAQRMKMKPATNFYAALSGILDHSFQGVKYGAMSRQFFLQQAIGKTQEVFPYLLKGENKFVPGPYLMSKGYLPSVAYQLTDEDGATITFSDAQEGVMTIGNISTGLKNANSFLQDGDQITLIFVEEVTIDGVSNFIPYICRFLIDTTSTEEFAEVAPNFNPGDAADDLWKPTPVVNLGEHKTAGFCVIVSRKNVSGGEVWQRSTERMAVSERVYNMYMSPDAYADALESYKRTAASKDSDYYLNDAETPDEVSGGTSYSFTNQQAAFTLGNATENITSVIAQNENGAQATCAEYGFYEDETPDQKNAWIQPYYIRGRQLVAADRVNLAAPAGSSLTARFNGQAITVYNPTQFVARFSDLSLG